jgi:hypothetical protein
VRLACACRTPRGCPRRGRSTTDRPAGVSLSLDQSHRPSEPCGPAGDALLAPAGCPTDTLGAAHADPVARSIDPGPSGPSVPGASWGGPGCLGPSCLVPDARSLGRRSLGWWLRSPAPTPLPPRRLRAVCTPGCPVAPRFPRSRQRALAGTSHTMTDAKDQVKVYYSRHRVIRRISRLPPESAPSSTVHPQATHSLGHSCARGEVVATPLALTFAAAAC